VALSVCERMLVFPLITFGLEKLILGKIFLVERDRACKEHTGRKESVVRRAARCVDGDLMSCFNPFCLSLTTSGSSKMHGLPLSDDDSSSSRTDKHVNSDLDGSGEGAANDE